MLSYKRDYLNQEEKWAKRFAAIIVLTIPLIFFLEIEWIIGLLITYGIAAAMIGALHSFRCPDCQAARTRTALNKLHFCHHCGASLNRPAINQPKSPMKVNKPLSKK